MIDVASPTFDTGGRDLYFRDSDHPLYRQRVPRHSHEPGVINDERRDALTADHEGDGVRRPDPREHEGEAGDDHEAEEPAEIERPGGAGGEEGHLRAHRRPQAERADQ